jgi:hypothetical protein
MEGGAISGNTASSTGSNSRGGGVYVGSSSTFTKTDTDGESGVIYGDDGGGNSNLVKDSSGNVGTGRGHAVYYDTSPAKKRDATLGPGDDISTTDLNSPLW